VGHMTEKVVIPPPEEVVVVDRLQVRQGDVPPDLFRVYRDRPMGSDGFISPMVAAGEGYRIHVTGLTHDERGYPVMNAQAQEWNVRRLIDKIRSHRDAILQVEAHEVDDAEVVVVSYGISARTALWPVELARQEGIRVGTLRLISVWPFPDETIRRLAKGIRAFVVPEINMGQIVREVERCAAGQAQVFGANRAGGDILDAHHVLDVIRLAAGRISAEQVRVPSGRSPSSVSSAAPAVEE
jgi:2-oxoglutarate/2-oxoacid ferredoxin oxidoreductase subunit alpha